MSGTVRMALIVGLLFLVSMYKSCVEVRLSLFGSKGEAIVDKVMMQVDEKTHEQTGKYYIQYAFAGGETAVSGQVNVSQDEAGKYQPGSKLPVLYSASNPEMHRVIGHREVWWIPIFLIFLVAAVVMGLKVYNEAAEDVRKSHR